MPDAGGLVIASDHAAARAYALLLQRRTGSKPTVVLSDDPQASRKIAEFNRSDERWMVAVRMVSEGVDIPRAACLDDTRRRFIARILTPRRTPRSGGKRLAFGPGSPRRR